MISFSFVAAIAALLLATSLPTGMKSGAEITAGGEAIDIRVGHLVPCVLDWNRDGKKDLLVGQFASGGIRLYLNQGTNAEPTFGEFSFLEAGGKQISLPAG